MDQVSKYWSHAAPTMRYSIDPQALRRFDGTHPACVGDWLAHDAEHHFTPDPDHPLTRRERKHRLSMRLERWFGLDLSRKHYALVR